jgi:putative FmdB family regulatory protein
MPLYEYQCEACGNRFEKIQKFSDPAPDACAKCGKGPVKRLPSSPAIQFKGSGFYITDYAKKSSPESSGKSSSGGDKSTDSKKSETSTTGTTSSSDKSDKSEKSDKSDKSDK